MTDFNYWEKVKDYAATFASFGNDWVMQDIIVDMERCRNDGEWFLEQLSDADFIEFARAVADYYYDNHYMK